MSNTYGSVYAGGSPIETISSAPFVSQSALSVSWQAEKYKSIRITLQVDNGVVATDPTLTLAGVVNTGNVYGTSGYLTSAGSGTLTQATQTGANAINLTKCYTLSLANITISTITGSNKRFTFSAECDNGIYTIIGSGVIVSTPACNGFAIAFASASTGHMDVKGYR